MYTKFSFTQPASAEAIDMFFLPDSTPITCDKSFCHALAEICIFPAVIPLYNYTA
jgi:hypothetical protein